MKLSKPCGDRDYFSRSTTDAPPDLASAIRLDWILDVKTELNVPMCAVDLVAVDGAVDHRDVFLSDAEKASNRHMCSCVSRLTGGRAVIDVGYRA